MYLLDTNVLSEIRKIKQHKANENLVSWVASVRGDMLYTNVVVLMELEKGILRIRRKDPKQANALQSWFFSIKQTFKNRTFMVDNTTASICASLHVPNPVPDNDAWIAATAVQHNLTLVTRNQKDFAWINGLATINPFEAV